MRTIHTSLGLQLEKAGIVPTASLSLVQSLRERMDRDGLSVKDVSVMSGIQKSVLRDILRGQTVVYTNTIRKLSKIFPELSKFEAAAVVPVQAPRPVPTRRVVAPVVRPPEPVINFEDLEREARLRITERAVRRMLEQSGKFHRGLVFYGQPDDNWEVVAVDSWDWQFKVLARLAATGVIRLVEGSSRNNPHYVVADRSRLHAMLGEPERSSPVQEAAPPAPETPPEPPPPPEPSPVMEMTIEAPPIQPEPENAAADEVEDYVWSDSESAKIDAAHECLRRLAAAGAITVTRMDLFTDETPIDWQRAFLGGLHDAGYVLRQGERHKTRYTPLEPVRAKTFTKMDVARMLWPGRSFLLAVPATQETQERPHPTIPPPAAPDAPPDALVHAVLELKRQFYEGMEGQLSVIVSHGEQLDRIEARLSQLDRVERKLDRLLQEWNVDPETVK